jgi:hypothetical protein
VAPTHLPVLGHYRCCCAVAALARHHLVASRCQCTLRHQARARQKGTGCCCRLQTQVAHVCHCNLLILHYHTVTSMGSTQFCGQPSYIFKGTLQPQLLTAASASENETHQVQCYSPPAAVTWVVLWSRCRLAQPPAWLTTAAVGRVVLLLSAAWTAPAPSCPWMLGRPAATSDSVSCRRASNKARHAICRQPSQARCKWNILTSQFCTSLHQFAQKSMLHMESQSSALTGQHLATSESIH